MTFSNAPSMITPRWRLFARVAELGSLTKAATVLDMQQSAISVQISALERECGGKLFSRTGRGVVLTSLGELALGRVQQILNDAEQLFEDILASSHVPAGPVRVGVVSSLAHPFINQLFRVSRTRHPLVQLQIAEGFSGQIDEWVANGQIDIGIAHRYGKRLSPGAEKLFGGPSYFVGTPAAGELAERTISFSDLHMLPLVLPGMPSGLRLHLEQIAKRKGIRLNIMMEANSLSIVKDIVAEGGFYTILPYQAVHREVSAGAFAVSKITGPVIDRSAALLTTTQKPLSFAARETTKIMRETLASLLKSGLWVNR